MTSSTHTDPPHSDPGGLLPARYAAIHCPTASDRTRLSRTGLVVQRLDASGADNPTTARALAASSPGADR